MRFTFLKKKRFYIPLILVILITSLCLYEKYKAYDYAFHIPEVDLYVFTKKIWGGKFIVMFSDHKDGIRLSPEVDYVEVNTRVYIKLVLDKNNKKQIALSTGRSVYSLNQVHYQFTDISELGPDDMLQKYGEKESGEFKEQYYVLDIASLEYRLNLFKTINGRRESIRLKDQAGLSIIWSK